MTAGILRWLVGWRERGREGGGSEGVVVVVVVVVVVTGSVWQASGCLVVSEASAVVVPARRLAMDVASVPHE